MPPIRTILWRSAAFVGILVALSINAVACSCRGPAVCEAFHPRDTAFVADILSRRIVEKGDQIGSYRVEQSGYQFRVRVVERFSGPAVGQEVFVETGLGGGDCAYLFDVGQRYLIDASAEQGVFFTSICSLTGLARPDSIVLRELRGDASGKRIPDVSGTVMQSGPPLKWGDEKPLQGIRVSLQHSGQLILQAMTDENGVYTFDSVPGGAYQVVVDGLPRTLAVSGSNLEPYLTDDIGELQVPEHTNGSPACHLWISAEPSGTISGHINGSRKTLSDVYVSAYRLKQDGHKGEAVCFRGAKQTGEFRLPYLPAGQYLVVFERGSKSSGPSVVVNLADGEQKNVGEIKLR